MWPGLTPDTLTGIYFHQQKNLFHIFGRISSTMWPGLTPDTSAGIYFHKTEEFTSYFWLNFSTIWQELTPDTSTLSPTEEFPLNFRWGFFHCLNGTNPRHFDGQAIFLSLRCQINAVRNKEKFVFGQGRFYVTDYLVLKCIWRIYRLH